MVGAGQRHGRRIGNPPPSPGAIPPAGVEWRATALWALCAALALLPAAAARAQVPVSIELALAVDTSMSINGSEYDFLMQGIAGAFRAPEIIALIESQDGVAVTLFQWSSAVDARSVIPWQLLRSRAGILAFAARVEAARRAPVRGFTGIGEAIRFGVRAIAQNDFDGRLLRIDVSGDGRSNFGLPPAVARQAAGALGIVINGLPILTYTDAASRGLEIYYREQVIYGPGAFVEIADDYEDFARAFRRKLLRELSPRLAGDDVAPPAPGALAYRAGGR